jgi:MFS family permease
VSLLGLAAPCSSGSSAIWIVMALASFRGFWGYFAVPAWTSLTADVVPLGIRGRFLASRNFGMGVATLATAPLAGYLIDHFTGLHGWQLVWLIAFATGAISTWCYAQIPDRRSILDYRRRRGRSRTSCGTSCPIATSCCTW